MFLLLLEAAKVSWAVCALYCRLPASTGMVLLLALLCLSCRCPGC